jgi:hypothetical protein
MNLLVDVEKAIAKWKPFLDEMKAKNPNFEWIHHDYFGFPDIDIEHQKYLDKLEKQRKQRIRKEKLDKIKKASS